MRGAVPAALRSASVLHVLCGIVQRVNVIVATVAIARRFGAEVLGSWAVAQSLSLAVYSLVAMALAQALIAAGDDEDPDRAFRMSLLLIVGSNVALFGLLYGLPPGVGGWLGGLSRLGDAGFAATFLYTLGVSLYSLLVAHLFSRNDARGLGGALAGGGVALCAAAAALLVLDMWSAILINGALYCGVALFLCARLRMRMRSWLAPVWSRRFLGRAASLGLTNALVNPVVFVSVSLVERDGGLAAAGIYGLANQLRNVLLLVPSLLLPLYLRSVAQRRTLPAKLGWMAAGAFGMMLAALGAYPQAITGIFGAGFGTPDTLDAVRLALLVAALSCGCMFLGQRLLASSGFWHSVWLNGLWCIMLLGLYRMLVDVAPPATAMMGAMVAAYAGMAALLLLVLYRGARN